MKVVRRADGVLEVQVGMEEFTREWRTARDTPEVWRPLEDRGMPRRRPGIFVGFDKVDGTERVLTPYPALWEVWVHEVTRRGEGISRGQRRCRQCGKVSRPRRELEGAWIFRCDACRALEVAGKGEVGGTVGAGEAE